MQPVVTNKLTENPKDQFEEKKHSSESIEESVEQKSSVSSAKKKNIYLVDQCNFI